MVETIQRLIRKVQKLRFLTVSAMIGLCLAGCQSAPYSPSEQGGLTQAVQSRSVHNKIDAHNSIEDEFVQDRKYYSVTIKTHDRINISATVYQPALKKGEKAPLILHSHGFSMRRMDSPFSFYGLMMFGGKTALAAWKQGYWVISYDQRGHGDSQGKINLMSPDHEVRDVSTIIDWAVDNLPHLAFEDKSAHPSPEEPTEAPEQEPTDNPLNPPLSPTLMLASLTTDTLMDVTPQLASPRHQGDPLVGMIGESYTGSAQLLASTKDKRIDALIPLTTWYDLSNSLIPNNVPKMGWLTTLIFSGNTLNPGKMHPQLNRAYLQVHQGKLNNDFADSLRIRSLKAACGQQQYPNADALIIQGMRDSLFSFNHGVGMRQCLQAAGRDVRLIGAQGGHLLPLAQRHGLKAIYSFDKTIHCGQKKLNTRNMALDWFDDKLKKKANASDYIPDVCMSINKNLGVEMSEVPIGGDLHTFEPVRLYSGMAGFWELALRPFDWLSRAVKPNNNNWRAQDFQSSDGYFRPAFIPLAPATEHGVVVGIPTVDIQLESLKDTAETPTVFLAIGTKRRDSQRIDLLNDQVTPITGIGRHQIQLNAISHQMKKGEMVGLVISGYSNQFRFSGSGIKTAVAVSGSVDLPIQVPERLLLTQNLAPLSL